MPAAVLVAVQKLYRTVKTDKPRIARLGVELAQMIEQ